MDIAYAGQIPQRFCLIRKIVMKFPNFGGNTQTLVPGRFRDLQIGGKCAAVQKFLNTLRRICPAYHLGRTKIARGISGCNMDTIVPVPCGKLAVIRNQAVAAVVLPLIYTGLSSGLRQCELITLSWAGFHVRYKYILRGQRLLILNEKTAHLLEQIPETGSPYVFLNPKTEAPYKLHEFYYLHKKILKQARLPWVAFRDLQRQCMEVGI